MTKRGHKLKIKWIRPQYLCRKCGRCGRNNKVIEREQRGGTAVYLLTYFRCRCNHRWKHIEWLVPSIEDQIPPCGNS